MLAQMLFMQPPVPALPTSLNFHGKTVLVTGANSGLGRAACLHYLQRNVSTLIITVRRASEGEAVKAELLAHPDVKNEPKILVFELDLSSHSSVIAFASKLRAEIDCLHIALLNAGVFLLDWKVSPHTQNEMTFQVNYLSNAILSLLLLPLLRATAEANSLLAPSYLSIVASQKYNESRFIANPIPESTTIFDAFNDEKGFQPWSLYADSKLLVRLFVKELAKHVDPSSVIINCMCPGMVKTNLARNLSFPLRLAGRLVLSVRARSPEVGSRVLVNAAGGAGKESHGEMLVVYQALPVIPWIESKEGERMQTSLWRETVEEAEKNASGAIVAASLL
ncbi:hypothetical protein DFJ43DRAFT_283497 [Lentinula guzmanii]|uniref:NAD(P)-binding protein n=1 Tax=Lentinula guzmanii TaxID=2804957 RepID=A0AA38JKA3_9AGAR|nr:hypothetical protein DFJ43DRAFT_283497 [Lentinula guzmanii]